MKIKLITVGKTEEPYLKSGIDGYNRRLSFYIPFEMIEIPSPKIASSMPLQQIKQKEAAQIEKHLQHSDFLILLDEHGREFSSVDFAGFLGKQFNNTSRNLVFVVGGPFGFDETLQKKADALLSLSKMTFSHQMVRLFFVEQLYRAMTILKGESYHHE